MSVHVFSTREVLRTIFRWKPRVLRTDQCNQFLITTIQGDGKEGLKTLTLSPPSRNLDMTSTVRVRYDSDSTGRRYKTSRAHRVMTGTRTREKTKVVVISVQRYWKWEINEHTTRVVTYRTCGARGLGFFLKKPTLDDAFEKITEENHENPHRNNTNRQSNVVAYNGKNK